MLRAEIPWAHRVWALPFLTVPAPSRHYHEARGRRHKTITDWARQMLCVLRRGLPDRELVVVGDRTYATLKLLAACQGMNPPVTFLTRLRLDAVLPDPPAPPGRASLGGPGSWGPVSPPCRRAWPTRPRSGPTCASAGCSCATRPGTATPRPCSAPTPTGPRPPSSPPASAAGRWRPRSWRSAPTWASRPSTSGRRKPRLFPYPRPPPTSENAPSRRPRRPLLLGLKHHQPLIARTDFVQSPTQALALNGGSGHSFAGLVRPGACSSRMCRSRARRGDLLVVLATLW